MLIHTNITFLPNFDPNNLYLRPVNLMWIQLYHYYQGPIKSINITIDYYEGMYLQGILLAKYGSRTLTNLSGKNYIKRTFNYYIKALVRI